MATGEFNLNSAKEIFFAESREMLDNMEICLLKLEKESSDEEVLNSLFRSVHTIKGSSGMFGFDEIEKFTHVVENIMDQVRQGITQLDSDLSTLLFKCHDYIQELLDYSEQSENKPLTDEMDENKRLLIQSLNSYLSLDAKIVPEAKPEEEPEQDEQNEEAVENDCWHISLRFKEDTFRDGFDPYSFITYLNEIGKIENIALTYDDMPVKEEMDPESCYLGFEIYFRANVNVKKETIEDVFDFIKDDCNIRLIPPNSNINDYVSLINDLAESPMKIGEMLVEVGSLTQHELDMAIELQHKSEEMADGEEGAAKRLGDIIVEEQLVPQTVLDAALEKQEIIKKADISSKKLIRINADKIDTLINLVGELVINGSNVKQLSERNDDTELVESVSTMTRLIEDIRDSTMNIRMVPIGETFRKYERIVRDLSLERNKEVELVVSGGETELDKTLIDKLSDPLMHIVRNAVDHGIDSPEEREAKGKNRKGTIYLNAYYETGSVVIAASDDGNGLDREKIYKKAIELELIQPGENISDDDLFQLVFEPGFSTAKEITNISGRGVGMDVVKRNIEALRGTVVIENYEGEGTSIRIHLPLTLAIIDGFMVQVGEHYYIIPLEMVIECTEISEEILAKNEGGNFINLRGDMLPYMKLREFFKEDKHDGKENVVIVEYARRMAGLVVDKPIGEFQTVIKPLGKVFNQLKWISGATILGSGEVALILDVPRLIQVVESKVGTSIAKEVGV